MRISAILLVLAAPLVAQTPGPAPVRMTSTIAAMQRPGISRQTFSELEKQFDAQLSATGGAHPVDILGLTRGLYLEDYGVVFTAEISLVQTPAPNPFNHGEISLAQKNEVHRMKVENLPLLRKTMREMVRTTAVTMNAAGIKMGILKPTSQLVLAVRLLYLPYENTIGLPGQIVMKADLKGALADDIKVEEQ